MTQSEYNKIRPGDVIFNMEENKGYVVTKMEEGHLECEDGKGWNSIPSKDILRWNWVSLMRERELAWEDMKKITFILGQVIGLTGKKFDGEQSVYEEVLRRFNEQINK